MIAFTNPGGIRLDVSKKNDGAVTYADLFASQPFRNQLVTLTLTGAQIKAVLEQQWADPARPRILQVSHGFSYAWDGSKSDGPRVIADSVSLDGVRLDPSASYQCHREQLSRTRWRRLHRAEGRHRSTGRWLRCRRLFDYVQANSPIAPPAGGRIPQTN